MLIRGFDPITRPGALAVILGTIPGQESLAAGEYYANTANAFWFIMERLFGAGRGVSYQERIETLVRNRVGIWDVLRSARRSGSSDSKIVRGSEEPNDFGPFFRAHSLIRIVFFNGGKAEELYRVLVVPSLSLSNGMPRTHLLPSTSPANTSLYKGGKAGEMASGEAYGSRRLTSRFSRRAFVSGLVRGPSRALLARG